MKKKIFRVIGYVVCGLLLALCILMIVSSSMFGAHKTVDIFGGNVYIVDNDELPTAPKGSAVWVKKCGAADLEAGNPVLYLKSDENDEPALGYVNSLTARDGVYYITAAYNETTVEFPESKLVGRADYSSVFWGAVIRFIKTPIGVMVTAVLPCAALILFDIVRASAANRPEPEVTPKVKNADEEQPHTDIKLSVDTEGKALYAKDRSLKPLPKDNDVLFNYSGRQKTASGKPERAERPIIPLTDRKTRPAAPENKTSDNTGKIFSIKLPSEVPETEQAPDIESIADIKPPADIPEEKSPDKTAELPTITKKTNGDAFFAQPAAGRQLAPQIGRQRRAPTAADDEEAAPRASRTVPERTAGKRSSQILASKSFDDLLSDEDDRSYRNNNDEAVDDILASIDRGKRR